MFNILDMSGRVLGRVPKNSSLVHEVDHRSLDDVNLELKILFYVSWNCTKLLKSNDMRRKTS